MKDEEIRYSAFRIAQVLKKNGWSQSELARQLGVSPQAVQQWVKGVSSPRGRSLKKLSEITGLPNHWFFMSEEEVFPLENKSIDYPLDLTEQHKILIDLFEKLPESDKKQLIQSLQEKQQHYDKLLEELAKARGKKVV
ncbi:helix-turn-helix domain-containing protein [Symbiopectobacterium sp.]|uniref:helix-turn-helix domain-containing protein n=1 Tax=Symbiopectobacterium sp. TaxID=2952789 RepID=UPI003F3151AF